MARLNEMERTLSLTLSLLMAGAPARAETGWELGAIPIQGQGTGSICLAVDRNGDTHAVAFDSMKRRLVYAKRNGDIWSTQVLAADEGSMSFSLALDPVTHHPRVAHTSSRRLKYSSWTGSAWETEEVPMEGIPWKLFPESLGLDARGRPWIAYYDGAGRHLKCAFKTAAGWSVSVVDAEEHTGFGSALALSEEGLPRIAYYTQWGHLKYASAAGCDGIFAWEVELVSVQVREGGPSPSLVLDKAGLPSIAFVGGDFELAHARKRKDGSWEQRTIVGNESFHIHNYWDPSLKLDSRGRAHMAYRDPEGAIWFASQRGNDWTRSRVDASSHFGLSLALDGDDAAHIAYGRGSADIGYARGGARTGRPPKERRPSPRTDCILISGSGRGADFGPEVEGVTVLDSRGRVVYGQEGGDLSWDARIEGTPAPAGLYIARVRGRDGDQGYRKILIVK